MQVKKNLSGRMIMLGETNGGGVSETTSGEPGQQAGNVSLTTGRWGKKVKKKKDLSSTVNR